MKTIGSKLLVAGSFALLGAAALTGCGGSGGSSAGSSTITVGNESPKDRAFLTVGSSSTTSTTPNSSTTESGPPAVKTPTSGPLSKEPKVTSPGGAAPTKLQTKDLIAGTGAEAKAGDKITVNYVGVLFKNSKKFNASWENKEPFHFTLGQGAVIKGWDEGIAGMKAGGRRELIIPSALAYGAKGSRPAIPGNEALVFVVDLLST